MWPVSQRMGHAKDEIEDQRPKAEDLAMNVATGRQGRRPGHQRGIVARKAAEFGIKNKIIGQSQAKTVDAVPTFSGHEIFWACVDVEMSSCSQHNQAVLEIASFERKGLNSSIAKAMRQEVDIDALLQFYGIMLFYFQMDGDSWENKENWLEDCNFCGWFGVTCSTTLRMSSLVLRSNGLAGTLPIEMHLPTNLLELDSSENEGIYGTLPAEFMSEAESLRKSEDERWCWRMTLLML
jgi:hypothetical protein